MATATMPAYRTAYTVRTRDRSGENAGDMEGTTHAVTGVVTGLLVGLVTSAPHAHGIVVAENVGRDALYGALVAGFALLPDADHPKASFAYSAGPLSHGVSHIVAVLFGGHRAGMHSLFGIGAMALVTELLGVWLYPSKLALGILALLIAMCICAGLKAVGFVRHGFEAFAWGCALSAVAMFTVRADLWWLVALGMALHIVEDEFTGHGCAVFWPVSRKRFGGDGRQPVARRATSPARRAAGSRRPASRPAPGPGRTGPRPSKPACLNCLVGECGECRDRGCGCPQAVHPARPKRKTATATVIPETVSDEILPPEDDVPPY